MRRTKEIVGGGGAVEYACCKFGRKHEGWLSLIVGFIEEKEWANGVGEGIRWDFTAAS